MKIVGVNVPEREQRLSCAFDQARKSLFPLRRSSLYPGQGAVYQTPWVGKSAQSLLGDEQSAAMLKILKDQQAYVMARHDHLLKQQRAEQKSAEAAERDNLQLTQMALIGDMLKGFQESVMTMMQISSDMVQKVCTQPAFAIAQSPPPPVFQKSAVSHKRPVIRAAKEEKQEGPMQYYKHGVSNDVDANTIHVLPHPISKRLERVGE